MKSAMRKLISLCVLAMVAISPLAMAQDTGAAPEITVEAAISAAMASEGSAEAAYTKLTSPDDTTLSADQKEALVALGSEAGAVFIAAVSDGSSFVQAGAAAAAVGDVSNEQINTLVARLNSPTSGEGNNQQTAGVTNQSEGEQEGEQTVQTETAAGPGTTTPNAPTDSGATPPPAAPGAGGGGGGTGGGVVSGN